MKFKGYPREYTDAKLRRAEAELRNGRSIPEICEIIGVEVPTFMEWAATIPRQAEQLNNTPLKKAVCPIFWMPHGIERMEQIGSGVLLRLFDEIFLLTCAHVTDSSEDGDLYIPGRKQIVPINGHLSHSQMPTGTSRETDRLDMAYYRLARDLQSNIDARFHPIEPECIDPHDRPRERDLYTFVGYPWRKTSRRGLVQESEQFTFTGEIAPDEYYQRFGYSEESHFLIRFRRNKAFTRDTSP